MPIKIHMMNKRKTGLKARIQGYMEDVTIDVFGYEKKVVSNVTAYLESLSKSSCIPVGDLQIRIAQPQGKLEAHIYRLHHHLRQASFNELVNFFMGEGASTVFDMEAKVHRSIHAYLTIYAEEKNLPLQELDIRIYKLTTQVKATSYHRGELVSDIPIKALIKHFKG